VVVKSLKYSAAVPHTRQHLSQLRHGGQFPLGERGPPDAKAMSHRRRARFLIAIKAVPATKEFVFMGQEGAEDLSDYL
jgi:hypothetical protein